MGIAQSPTLGQTTLAKQEGPIPVRAAPDIPKRLDDLAQKLGKTKHAIASAALRLGIAELEKNGESFYAALVEAEKAKSAVLTAATDSEKESNEKPTKSKK